MASEEAVRTGVTAVVAFLFTEMSVSSERRKESSESLRVRIGKVKYFGAAVLSEKAENYIIT
jgi:hypothetical protein